MLMRWLFALLAMLALASYAADTEKHASKTKPNKQGTETNPVFVKILPSQESQNTTGPEKKHEENETRLATATELLADRTKELVYVTGVLAALTFLLFGANVFLVRDAKKSMEAANRSAAAAEQMIARAEDTARKELRAYLGIPAGEVYILPNNILRGVVEIKNLGKTPAYKVRPAVTGELRKAGEKRPFNDPDFIPHVHSLAPTMHWTVGHEFLTMSDRDLADVISEQKVVYIWGRVTYEDIYGKEQTLRFRFRNVVKEFVATEKGPAIRKWYYYPEDEGNEAT